MHIHTYMYIDIIMAEYIPLYPLQPHKHMLMPIHQNPMRRDVIWPENLIGPQQYADNTNTVIKTGRRKILS